LIKTEEDEMGRHAARMGEMRNTHRILIGKLEWKRPAERVILTFI
jgi:hypothetical protein